MPYPPDTAIAPRKTRTSMQKRNFLAEIFLIAFAALVLEISFTRIFSFKLYYYFTYLIIGIAMLGLGSGGVVAAVSTRIRESAPEKIVDACALIAAALVPFSYLIVALVQLNPIDFVDGYGAILRLILICLSLFAPFVMVGIALAVLFGSFPKDMHRLYFADLLGAGMGCALCVPIFTLLSPIAGVMLAGACLAAAGTLGAHREGSPLRTPGLGLVLVLILATLGHGSLPEPVPDRTKTLSPQRRGGREVLFSSWSALFRIDVLSRSASREDKVYIIAHDGNAGSGLHKFNGDYSTLGRFDEDIRLKPFSVLGDAPHVLIIGAAGGHEILASLHFGAGKITAVELNPVTVGLLREDFAEYTGRIAYHPKVDLINAEGRSFLQRSEDKYDLIWFVAPDSYSAMNAASSGAFVLSESYLFTVEMIRESLSKLTDNGIVCVQWGEMFSDRHRATRYLATAREAFRSLGVENASEHILLSTGPGMLPTSTIILRRKAFSAEEVHTYNEAIKAVPKTKLWNPVSREAGLDTQPGQLPAGAAADVDHPMIQALSLTGADLDQWNDEYGYHVTPVTDDSPFFWHFTRFRDAFSRPWRAGKDIPAYELATGEQTLLILLGVATAFAGVFLLLPLALIQDVWKQIPTKGYAVGYFGALGLGFMFFEVCLIQKLTLVLGYPTYSLTVTLFSLLIFAGIGSFLSETYTRVLGRNRALVALLGVLIALTTFYLFGLPGLEVWFAKATFPARVIAVIAILAPLGLCLGAFMPIGVSAIAGTTKFDREYIAWAWAVNGFFSVVSSVLSTILAMTIGFNMVLIAACVIYGLGIFCLSRIPETA